MSDDELASLGQWETSDRFDDRDRAALAFTDALARDNQVPDALFAEVAKAFSEPEILKLSFTVGLAGMVNRVHAAFRTDIDPATVDGAADTPFCAIPRRG